jgi:hypothetical protein
VIERMITGWLPSGTTRKTVSLPRVERRTILSPKVPVSHSALPGPDVIDAGEQV